MSQRPNDPPGSVSEFGYRRVSVKDQDGKRRLVMEHRLVWEAVNGVVPRGFELHHVNHDKLDNRIENLRIVNRLEHKRIHSGCRFIHHEWWKKCRVCEKFLPVSMFYEYPGRNGVMGLCKPCARAKAKYYRKKRRERKAKTIASAPAEA